MQELPTPSILTAGDLSVAFERTLRGIRLRSVSDKVTDCEFMPADPLPLFTLTLRHSETGEDIRLDADSGWDQVAIKLTVDGAELDWQQASIAGLRVVAHITTDHEANALRWRLQVDNQDLQWSVWRVVFPQIAITELDPGAKVFFPRGPGEVQTGLWQREFRHQGLYPEPWTTMQFMAAYDEQRKTGLYVATHDPNAGAKDISVASHPEERTVTFTFDHPAEDMGVGGNGFVLSGEAIWQLLRGDWYDAAVIYRHWARREARWFPELGDAGREDTPQWMRELPVWTTASGDRAQVVSRVEAFAAYMGVPVGFHWYGWHQIPFDNDYPHYFPVTEGFSEGVRDLQQAGIYVMPYINGRLWDMHDRGVEDYQFTSVALPAATKDDEGQPYVEMYGSKEADGSPVRFAVMCPATELWQDRIRSICLRLFDEYHVDGVYIDQISAMSPKLCFDRTHGHPLGGGHWWVEGYWKVLQSIRDAMPNGGMLTSECNSEPFARWFDGYLTWTWQHDGQVPAYVAVYGGAIQVFGRAYRGGDTKDLALRMKAGQQLVFGEQIGWIDPEIVNEEESAAFLRQVVRLRWRLRRTFYAGEMCRPPRLEGDIPTIRADWQWKDDWWVTTDAVMTGAWRLPTENKLVLMFVNVGDSPVSARFHFDGCRYGIEGDQVRVTIIDQEETLETFAAPNAFHRELELPPRTAYAWEVYSV